MNFFTIDFFGIMVVLPRFYIYTKFWVNPILFPEQNKNNFYQMHNFFSCYVLILSIHRNPQTEVNIFKYFTSMGEYFYSNEKEKGKNLFLCKIWDYESLWKTPDYFFGMKKKENICLRNIRNDEGFWEAPNHFFCMKKKERKKVKKPFQGKCKAARVLWKLSYFFCRVPHKRR